MFDKNNSVFLDPSDNRYVFEFSVRSSVSSLTTVTVRKFTANYLGRSNRGSMRIRNISKKMVSLALTIAIIGTGSGINALANSVDDGKNSQKAADNKVTVVKELTDERTENSNTYLLSDGSKKTELFLSNIRYEKDGQLKDYENEIVDIGKNGKKSISTYGSGDKSSYKYVNKSSDNKAYFSDDIEDGIMLSHGKYILKMTPVFSNRDSLFQFYIQIYLFRAFHLVQYSLSRHSCLRNIDIPCFLIPIYILIHLIPHFLCIQTHYFHLIEMYFYHLCLCHHFLLR